MEGLETTQLPEWQLDTLDGSDVPAVSSFLGSPLLILFYNVGCPGCKARALPFANEMAARYPGLQVVGIHTRVDGPSYSDDQIEQVNKIFRLTFFVFKDRGRTTWELFKAEGTPHWLLVDAEGTVTKSIFGSMPNALQRLDLALSEITQNDLK